MSDIWNQMNYSQNIIDNFWKYVFVPPDYSEQKNQCWIWTGAKGANGKIYGTFTIKSKKYHKQFRSHRFIYECYYGQIPNGLHVCHHCDNPSCVNPDHLFLGTHTDNMRDKIQKNRQNTVIGEDVGTSKLSEQNVIEILEAIANDKFTSSEEIIHMYNVNVETIRRILTRQTWSHLTKKYTDLELNLLKNKVSPNSYKLTKEDVYEIKQKLISGTSVGTLAKKYKVTYSNIFMIKNGKSWKHIKI